MIKNFEEFNIKKIVDYYRRRLKRTRNYLEKFPNEWEIFQNKFNKEMDQLFTQIIFFEKRCIQKGKEEQLFRIKQLFVKRLRKHFYFGELPRWSIDKPYGYAGDFKIIDEIYKNSPVTNGYERLFDNYFLMSAISISVRNRKEDLKREILKYIKQCSPNKHIRIMNLGSGACREIKELLTENAGLEKRTHFDCYDVEKMANAYASQLLTCYDNISFITKNLIKIALSRDVTKNIGCEYDLIYSIGLFDYLNYKISVKLVKNLRKLLKKNGVLLIADMRTRYYNPSVFNMEWACGWDLIYRNDDEFKQIFIEAGFKSQDLWHDIENQGIIQYIRAVK